MKGVSGSSRCVFRLLAVAMLASGIAAADTIVVNQLGTGDGHPNGDYLYIDEENTSNGQYNGTYTNTQVYFAGNLDIHLTETGSPTIYDRITMCVELFTDIGVGPTYDTTVYQPAAFSAPTSTELEQIAYLLDTYDPITNNTLTNDEAAGLQLAIWKIATDGVDYGSNLSWTTGAVQEGPSPNQTTVNVFGYATTYLAASVGHYTNNAYVYFNYEANGTVVQMLEGPGGYTTGPPAGTPESSTFILAGVALLALGHTARRRLTSR